MGAESHRFTADHAEVRRIGSGIDLGLLAIFAVQHSLMARPFFKQWITRFIPEQAERSTYVLVVSLALILLVTFWQPLGGVIWNVEAPGLVAVLYGVFAMGWLLVLVSTFLINHFDLFGLRQSWLALRGRPYAPVTFRQPWLYRQVRHPLYVGFFIALWATPTMTITHLVFALMASATSSSERCSRSVTSRPPIRSTWTTRNACRGTSRALPGKARAQP